MFMCISIEFSISLTWENEECRDNRTKKWEGERESAWLERERGGGVGGKGGKTKTSDLASIMRFIMCQRRTKGFEVVNARTWRPMHAVFIYIFVALFVKSASILFGIYEIFDSLCLPLCPTNAASIITSLPANTTQYSTRQHSDSTPRMFHIAWSIFTVTPIFVENYNKQNYCRMYACFALRSASESKLREEKRREKKNISFNKPLRTSFSIQCLYCSCILRCICVCLCENERSRASTSQFMCICRMYIWVYSLSIPSKCVKHNWKCIYVHKSKLNR